ncbi:MAG TPA: hypothetical protein VHA30_03605, partial [Patescibacteria group bacterium]|nr:hypothetical protein [Patescibacteria group bacterium]
LLSALAVRGLAITIGQDKSLIGIATAASAFEVFGYQRQAAAGMAVSKLLLSATCRAKPFLFLHSSS